MVLASKSKHNIKQIHKNRDQKTSFYCSLKGRSPDIVYLWSSVEITQLQLHTQKSFLLLIRHRRLLRILSSFRVHGKKLGSIFLDPIVHPYSVFDVQDCPCKGANQILIIFFQRSYMRSEFHCLSKFGKQNETKSRMFQGPRHGPRWVCLFICKPTQSKQSHVGFPFMVDFCALLHSNNWSLLRFSGLPQQNGDGHHEVRRPLRPGAVCLFLW